MPYKAKSKLQKKKSLKDEEMEENNIEVEENQLEIESNDSDILNTDKNENAITTNPSVPAANVPEKIIIIFDRACDEFYTDFELNNGEKESPINTLKRVLKIFLFTKNYINIKHEFALIVLNENIATWMVDFTTDIEEIMNELDKIDECETEDVFSMNSIFETIMQNCDLPKVENISDIPSYILHAMLLYNRSYTIPECTITENINEYLQSPYFTFDILVTHEIPEANNHCQKIIDVLQSYAIHEKTYFFPIARNTLNLHDSMAKFLCHPLQRQKQTLMK